MEKNQRDILLTRLTERAKELRCIYRVIEILKDEEAELSMIFRDILEAIPPGWQHPTVCEARIIMEDRQYASVDFAETPWMQSAEIIIDNHVAGQVQVCYLQKVFEGDQPFLQEEQRLLHAIADHLGSFIFQRRLKKTFEMAQSSEIGPVAGDDGSLLSYESDEHWKWRLTMAGKIADKLDFERFGVEAIYLIGSTKNACAGPGSDIDLLIHFRGEDCQKEALLTWLQGWGFGLAELNRIKTGFDDGHSLIDAHIVTDEDIRNKSSYAVMIGSGENSARLLRSKENQ